MAMVSIHDSIKLALTLFFLGINSVVFLLGVGL